MDDLRDLLEKIVKMPLIKYLAILLFLYLIKEIPKYLIRELGFLVKRKGFQKTLKGIHNWINNKALKLFQFIIYITKLIFRSVRSIFKLIRQNIHLFLIFNSLSSICRSKLIRILLRYKKIEINGQHTIE